MPWKDLGLPREWEEELNEALERPATRATQGTQWLGPMSSTFKLIPYTIDQALLSEAGMIVV